MKTTTRLADDLADFDAAELAAVVADALVDSDVTTK
jgi:hypothetical protein